MGVATTPLRKGIQAGVATTPLRKGIQAGVATTPLRRGKIHVNIAREKRSARKSS